MDKISNSKPYDLHERTFEFSKRVRLFVRKLPKTSSNIEDGKQVIRSSGSVGANYIEANEAFSSKETAYWLRLIIETNDLEFKKEGMELWNEAVELKKIFSSIIERTK